MTVFFRVVACTYKIYLYIKNTYLTGTNPTLERVCAHLIFTNTTPEIRVAILVTKNWYMGHVEDSFISSPLKNRRRNKLAANVWRER